MLVDVKCPYCNLLSQYDDAREFMFCKNCGKKIAYSPSRAVSEHNDIALKAQNNNTPNLFISYNTTIPAIGMVTRIVSTGAKDSYVNGQTRSFHLGIGFQQIILKIGPKNYSRDIVISADNTPVRIYASFNGVAQITIDQPTVMDSLHNDQTRQSFSLIVPESLYFATYIAIADNRLFDREWYRIENTFKERGFSDDVRNNVLNIVLDRPEKVTMDQILISLMEKSADIRNAALRLGLEIAYSDDSYGEKESVVFQNIRTRLRIDRNTYNILCSEARSAVDLSRNNNSGEEIVVHAKSLYERYENCLFSADVYSDVIKEMSVIAKEDIDYASYKVEKIAQMYRVYPQMLKNQTDSIINYHSHLNNNEEKQQLQEFFKELLDSINNSLKNAEESISILRERQSAASESFTISFMGRTKAGKSTLHSVLLGGLNSDFIGKGSERTTRYNFVYDFEGMRIIDTPGIGAPGGKSDTEIAKEVADESDLICYVVTSDSIQETEFNFLRQLKDRNKPVLIMLNKKDNITRSEKKLQKFLDNPLGWYETDGEDAIQGHIDRINTYVQMNHDFHNFSIVPVHLLAAKLALKEEDPVKKEKLLTGSRINEFLKTLSDMVSSSGIIQRSQTIYNSAIYHLGEDKKSASEQIEVVGSLRKAFWKNSEDSINKIKEYSNKKRNDFITSFNSTFDAFLKEDVRRFADENYYLNSKELNDAWKQFLSSSQLERRLEVSYNKNWEQYQSKVQDILVEAEEDLNFSMEFGSLSNVKVGRVVDAKFAVGVVGSVLGLVGAICFFFSGPIGLALTGAGIIAGIIAAKMKDKEQRINSAQDKLYDSLVQNVEKMREKNLTELLKKYDSSKNEIIQQLIDYNNAIIISLDKINESMKGLDFNLKETIQDLNDAFGARIANYMIKAPFYSINDSNAMSQLTVEREFKKYILLKDSRLYIQPMHVDKEKMSDILQEKLYINEEVV